MTPERQRWWDSLPAEEKRVRQKMVAHQAKIYYLKSLLNNELIVNRNACMDGIRNSKYIIKVLRKQIAMRIISYGDHWKCPRCGRPVHYDYCKDCGQKLRCK